ncbi:MAG TPA: hypothetical protein VL402_03695 [Xanthobacteraceae bacterium]|nr:hypothetical protein [Xanthobacteraceae bacterium]
MSSTRARARTRTRTVIARSFAAALAFAGFASVPVRAQDASFFKGKTVTFYVGLSAGGGYDVNARLVARHIGKHIPGNPAVVVRNMPGGGGLVMTNYLANVAPKDGLHIGAPQRDIPFEPLLSEESHAKFDALKLQWLGSTNADTSLAVASRRSGIKTWQDLKTKELIVAGTGVATESVVMPYALRNLLGFKYTVIAGYPGGNQMTLAMQRGEVDGRASLSWTSLKPHMKEWVDSGDMVILYQQALKKHPDLPNVPLIIDLTDDPTIKQMLRVEYGSFQVGRPYFLAAGVPADRVTVLRRAFDETMKDKDFLADAAKADQEIGPTTGEDMQKILADIYATPKSLIARLQQAGKNKPDLKVLKGEDKKGGSGK